MIIEYFCRSNYGQICEYIKDAYKSSLITRLFGRRTVNPEIRRHLTEFTNGFIQWKEVLPT